MIPKYFNYAKVVFVLLLPMLSPETEAKELLKFSSFAAPMPSLALEKIRIAYQNLGFDYSIVELPASRSLKATNRGEYDGELLRIEINPHLFPNLIRVPTPLYTVKFYLFSLSDTEMSQSSIVYVGVLQGILANEKLPRHYRKVSVLEWDQMFEMLKLKRIDAFFASGTMIDYFTHQNVRLRSLLKEVGPSIFEAPIYHYIHKKHVALVPLLNEQFRSFSSMN